MSLILTPDMQARAVALADSYCEDFVRDNGVPDSCDSYGLCDVNGREVRTLAETSPHFQEAAQWLIDRGLAEIVKDDDGELIYLRDGKEGAT